ncbi:MAG: hypothetical protein PHX72_02160 [Candidatus Shapirobacteria bacterium]|nr:hypothetical protein [Candidatus Shapirobacteria bacterium]
MKKLLSIVLVILTFLVIPGRVLAQEINKFGIHILDAGEVDQAAQLVNSAGGDWGWITIVLRTNDLNQKKWQEFFNNCRRKHLIPLVRLATEIEDEAWKKPTRDDIDQLADFLANINWPVKDQYIVVFNETNHAKEWGNDINPIEYAQILDYAIEKFQDKDDNFKILNGGFDLAANNSAETMDVYRYWQIMNQAVPGIFNRLDGWSSHPYPNPGFIGKPTDQGRKSILGYRWEIATLKADFNVNKNLPVFISETGWPHGQTANNQIRNGYFLAPDKVAEYTKEAFYLWLADNQVKAITPFVLNYHSFPLDVFSWLDRDGQDYPHCQAIREMKKTAWWPEQINEWQVEIINLPKFLPINSSYQGKITLKNTGQSIWGEKPLAFKSASILVEDIVLPSGVVIEPGQSHQFVFNIKTSEWPETVSVSWENLDEKAVISFFNPSSLNSYKDNFWQKIIALVKVWWYRKIPQNDSFYQINNSND